MALFFLSFLGGVLTILSPCVLPLLPVIIGGSLGGKHDKLRPVIITGSLSLSIVLFTLILKWSTAFIAVPPRTWSIISGSLVVALGIVTVVPSLWEKLSTQLNLSGESNKLLAKSSQKRSWFGAVLVGFSLGPVFSSCSPTYALILATVLPQSFFVGTLNLFAYAIGLSLVLLLIAVFGQRLIKRLQWAANPEGWFKRGLGALFILVGILILAGVDKQIETALVERGFGITALEERLVEDVTTDRNTDVDK
jgi:cytochrome c biogenesis protein CcdA